MKGIQLIRSTIRHWSTWYRYDPKKYWTEKGKSYFSEYSPEGDRGESFLIQLLSEMNFRNLIDVGCGYGRYLKAFSKSFPSMHFAGVDISVTQIDAAKAYLGENSLVELKETDGIHLPYQDKSFDLSFTYGCMIHVPNDRLIEFFSEIFRVTNSKGLFYEAQLMNKGWRRFLSPEVIWYSHNYTELFNRFHTPYKILREHINGNTVTRLYLVDFENSASTKIP